MSERGHTDELELKALRRKCLELEQGLEEADHAGKALAWCMFNMAYRIGWDDALVSPNGRDVRDEDVLAAWRSVGIAGCDDPTKG